MDRGQHTHVPASQIIKQICTDRRTEQSHAHTNLSTHKNTHTLSWKETRNINWNTQREVSDLFPCCETFSAQLYTDNVVEIDSGASCWSGQFIRATIYCLTILQVQLPLGWIVKMKDSPRMARKRLTKIDICRHLNLCNNQKQAHKNTHLKTLELMQQLTASASTCDGIHGFLSLNMIHTSLVWSYKRGTLKHLISRQQHSYFDISRKK